MTKKGKRILGVIMGAAVMMAAADADRALTPVQRMHKR